MLTHGAIPSHTGNLLNISLEQARLEVGIGTLLLEANYDDYGFLLTFCWIKVFGNGCGNMTSFSANQRLKWSCQNYKEKVISSSWKE
jgi:hypothetical protein